MKLGTDYMRKNNIIELKEDNGRVVTCIILYVSKKDIEKGINASLPGLYGFRGFWYSGNGTRKNSYGKIYNLSYYSDIKVVRENIKGLSKKQLKKLLD